MINLGRLAIVYLYQRESGAGDFGVRAAKGAHEGPCEHGFSGTQITFQGKDIARAGQFGDPSRQIFRRRLS